MKLKGTSPVMCQKNSEALGRVNQQVSLKESAKCEVQSKRFFGSAVALPSRKTAVSPFANRYSLPFLARQEPRPPIAD